MAVNDFARPWDAGQGRFARGLGFQSSAAEGHQATLRSSNDSEHRILIGTLTAPIKIPVLTRHVARVEPTYYNLKDVRCNHTDGTGALRPWTRGAGAPTIPTVLVQNRKRH